MAKKKYNVIREEMLQVASNVAQEKNIDQDSVFSAMEHAGTPCPFEGKIGEDATKQWQKYDVERPDYDQYIQKLKRRHAIDNKTEFVPVDSEYNLYGDDD